MVVESSRSVLTWDDSLRPGRIILVRLSPGLAATHATPAGDSGSYRKPRWFADQVRLSDLDSGAVFPFERFHESLKVLRCVGDQLFSNRFNHFGPVVVVDQLSWGFLNPNGDPTLVVLLVTDMEVPGNRTTACEEDEGEKVPLLVELVVSF
tara:strand:- start:8 stop:460 length:453 start_codon:yes stop_codon:yes gene_type:complete